MATTEYRLDVLVQHRWMPACNKTGSRKEMEQRRRTLERNRLPSAFRIVPVLVNERNPFVGARRAHKRRR